MTINFLQALKGLRNMTINLPILSNLFNKVENNYHTTIFVRNEEEAVRVAESLKGSQNVATVHETITETITTDVE